MKQQSLDIAIPTNELFCELYNSADQPKYTFLDFVTSTGQVATALSACWMVHLFI